MSSSNANDSSTKLSENATTPKAKENEGDKTCVVCFKIVDIFSIGECDHPVCYECSTRMRVLCKQNECPICRRINQKVIFTSEVLPYKELDQKNRSCLYDKTYRICFTGQRAQNAFQRLLEHTCNKCNAVPFETGTELKEHLRKKHELFYCDLCTENLKIFSFERKAYTREQLAQHRRKGDPDNTSHRGHPLCEYCDQRYLDRDELFRHLRKEHYFCHFCDADGSNQFYADHRSLREHFIDQHFLCEDGDCKENFLSAAFRTDIDFKAHKANVHGQNSKQARTIDLQFNLAPRDHRQPRQEIETHGNNYTPASIPTTSASAGPTRKIIDARNEQEFPSLGNATVTVRSTAPLNSRIFGTSGLARTKENFPALGGNSSQALAHVRVSSASAVNASTLLFKTPAAKPSTGASNANKNSANKAKSAPSKSINDFPALPPGASPMNSKKQSSNPIEAQPSYNLSSKPRTSVQSFETVSSKKSTPANQKLKTIQRTEAIKAKKQNLESDLIEVEPIYNLATVSSKHRQLVQSYESVTSQNSSQANQKLKTIQQAETRNQSTAFVHAPVISSKKSFPALGGPSTSATAAAIAPPQWLNATGNGNKKPPQMSKKLKVAPAPLLPTAKSTASNGVQNGIGKQDANANKNGKSGEKTKSQATLEYKKENAKVDTTTVEKNASKSKATKNTTKKTEEKENIQQAKDNHTEKKSTNATNANGNGKKTDKKSNKNLSANNNIDHNLKLLQNGYSVSNETINSYSSVANFTMPPPGFAPKSNEKVIKVPPGFESLANESTKTFSYISPSNALLRNQILVSHFMKSLEAPAVEEFRNVSKLFRQGLCNARAYYEHCEIVLGDRFEAIFPELLVLLPDINKQQELYETYFEQHNQSDANELNNYIQVCDLCRQVLKRSDFAEHWKFHIDIEKDNKLNKNFPKLSLKK